MSQQWDEDKAVGARNREPSPSRAAQTSAGLAARRIGGRRASVPLAVGFLVILLAGWGLGELVDSVREHDALAGYDPAVASWMIAHRTGWLTVTLRIVTDLGGIWLAVPLVAAAALAAPLGGSRWRTVGVMVLVSGGTSLLVNGVKLLIARPRPTLADMIATASGYSFPSGHSAQAAAAYASLAYLLTRRWPTRRMRLTAWHVAGLVALAVGFSRLYLGVHWLTDVLGGYLLATLWTTTVWTVTRWATGRGRRVG